MAKWTHKIDVDCPEEGRFTVMANSGEWVVLDEFGGMESEGEWEDISLRGYLNRLKGSNARISIKRLPEQWVNK